MCVCKGRRKEGKGQLNRFTRLNRFTIMNQFTVESIQSSFDRFNPKVGGISYKNLGSVQKHKFYQNSAIFDAPNHSQVPSIFLGFILLGFPPTLAYRDHLAAIGVRILSTVQEELIITSKEIRFEVVAVSGFFSVKSSRLDPTDHKGILLILGSLGFVLIVCNSNKK